MQNLRCRIIHCFPFFLHVCSQQHASFFDFSSQFKKQKQRERERERENWKTEEQWHRHFRERRRIAQDVLISKHEKLFFLFFFLFFFLSFSVSVSTLRTSETLMLRVHSVRRRTCPDFGVNLATRIARNFKYCSAGFGVPRPEIIMRDASTHTSLTSIFIDPAMHLRSLPGSR